MDNLKRNVYLLKFIPPLLVFLLLGANLYARYFGEPYLGFLIDKQTGVLQDVYVRSRAGSYLLPGDKLLQVNGVSWVSFARKVSGSSQGSPFKYFKNGDTITFEIQRGNQRESVSWVLPGPTLEEILYRSALVWVPIVYWLIGTLIFFEFQFKNHLWRLLVAYNYLTAIWLMAALTNHPSLWYSGPIGRAGIWLCLPVYWHLHWHFPRPLTRLPVFFLWIIYPFGIGMALLELLHKLPPYAVQIGFFSTAIGSLLLLAAHIVGRPVRRRARGMLNLALAIVLLPTIGLGINFGINRNGIPLFVALLMIQPGIPIAYYIIGYRVQNYALEMRFSRAIALILYGSLIFLIASILILLILGITGNRSIIPMPLITLPTLMIGLVTAIYYAPFQDWVNRFLLGMPLVPTHVIETYATRIPTSLDRETIIRLLRDEIFPTLLIHRAAMISLDESGKPSVFFSMGVNESQLPGTRDIPSLLAQAGKNRSPEALDPGETLFTWIRLVLPLTVEEEMVGLLLLGQRDIEDYYGPNEVATLQVLSNQTALALVNINQAERLQIYYRAGIEREETEHTRLARELHDEVLGQMALLAMSINPQHTDPQFTTAYQKAVDRIRTIISGLRPGLLMYGLYPAFQQLVDEIAAQASSGLHVELAIEPHDSRYQPEIELHIYRIVQQACRNALQHAHAKTIRISGWLEEKRFDLLVQDDGVGIANPEQMNLNWLLENQHYGLVGMYERAALIGSGLEFISQPGMGFQVHITYP
jgi:signal transduction histidine kinase